MPQIDAIRFRKYKSFGEEYSTIPLKRMTVLIGRNNSGKSSCIDVIEAFCKPNVLDRLRIDLSVEKKFSDEEWRAFFQPRIPKSFISTFLQMHSEKCDIFDIDGSDIQMQTTKEDRDYIGIIQKAKSVIDKIRRNINCLRLNSERDIVPEEAGSSLEMSVNGTGATNLINHILNNDEYDENLIQRSLLDALNTIMYPESIFTGITIQRVGNKKWEVFLYEDGARYPLSKTGSGLKTIILVLLNMLVIPELQKKEAEQKAKTNHTDIPESPIYFFAFEELENNLHPALQRRLFDYIERYIQAHRNTYVFLTTHSHVPINMFADQEDAQILHVTKENGVSSLHVIDDFISKSEVLNDLDVRASDLLQSNGIIWVEGPSDRVYIKHWMEIWGGGDLREGIDYQFLYYGGKLLSHYSADESQEDNELISILTTNRNSAIVIDSDKTSQSKPINNTKKRIQAEFDKLNLFCWITKGKEIENYVPCQAINDSFGCELAQCGKYELFPDYIKSIRPSFISEKVRFASNLIGHINADNSESILDLKQQIQKLINTVRGWTSDKHSSQT